MRWRIYYEGGWAEGSSRDQWVALPDGGVQVVVVMAPPPADSLTNRLRTGFVGCDRLKPGVTFYTGVDEYDPLGYEHVKYGSLLPDDRYKAVWDEAYGNH